MQKNNYFILIIAAMLLFSGCRESEAEKLAAKKEQLAELKREVAKLESELLKVGYNADSASMANAKIVTVISPEKTDFRTFLEASGKVTSTTNLMVSSELGGIITFLNTKEGNSVSKGQVLGQVDKSILESNIIELETSMLLAQQAYDRQKNLWDQKIGTEFQFLQAKNNLESLQKRLVTLKTQRDKANIIAPISGVVDKIFHYAGEMVSPGMPVVQVVNLSNIEVEAEIAESYLSKIKRGDKISIHFPSINQDRLTVIKSISQVINPGNRTFKIQAVLSNPDGAIKPNMLAIVKLTEYIGMNKILIPTKLIQEDMDGTFVNLVDSMNVVERQYITAGYTNEGKTEVDSGLEGRERIIDLGFRLVSFGDKVRVQ